MRSKINGKMIAMLAGVNKDTVYKYPQRYFRESYVRKLFEPFGYTVIVEQERGKAIYYVKKKFADRQAEVDAFNGTEWDEDLGELEDLDNNGEGE